MNVLLNVMMKVRDDNFLLSLCLLINISFITAFSKRFIIISSSLPAADVCILNCVSAVFDSFLLSQFK